MRTMTCLIGAEHDIAVHLCNFIKDSRGSSRVLPYHAQKKNTVSHFVHMFLFFVYNSHICLCFGMLLDIFEC